MSAQPISLLTELNSWFDLTQLANNISTNFHFIRPWWLLAFLALFLLLLLLKKMRYYQSPWQHFLPAHLASALVENSRNQSVQNSSANAQKRYWLKPLIIGICTILALAGPAWQKLPQPVYQLERGAVLIMDMSYSMFSTDVKPNRLTRARYKAIDLLKQINEGDVGLIAYAGDAFIISPLTQDIKNIELLLPSLSPDIMPSYGANALTALTLADKTLKNAGHISGDIYWFTDDIDNEEMSDIYQWANANNHKVNILGIGSKAGAPITLSSGQLLKDNRGAIVIPKLPEARLSAIAQRSRGVYRTMTNNDSDIKALTAHLTDNINNKVDMSSKEQASTQQLMQGDQYQEQGPWLLIIILPLLLTYFRRGSAIVAISWLMPLSLVLSLTSISPTSYANENALDKPLTKPVAETLTNSASQLWQNLWQTPDQQAQQHFQQQDYQQAAKQFQDSQWQGSAHYKAGDYQQALQAFKQSDSAQALYNQGNALAQLQQLDEAIDAYKEALAKDANLTDAKDNLEKLETLKKQQEQQQQKNQKGDKQSQDDQQDGQQSQQGSPEGSQEDNQQQNQETDKQAPDPAQGDSKADNADKNETEKQQSEQSEQAKQQAQEQQEEQAKQAQATDDEQQPSDKKSLAQQALDNKAQETEQKHQQLLNKVTDDPYLLLRNKMRLEYQKRQHEGAPQGVTKKW